MVNSGIENGNLLYNLRIVIFVLSLFLIGMILLWLVAKFCPFKKIRTKAQKKFDETIKKTFFNGLIKSMSVSFLIYSLALATQISEFRLMETD